jgi:hypothetical protein
VSGAVAALRAFARTGAQVEETDHCDLCRAALPARHEHLVELGARALRCACSTCARLGQSGTGRPARRIERTQRRLGQVIDDAGWAALGIPIGLAFIVRWSDADEVVAYFPSAGGAAASPLDRGAWTALVAQAPALAGVRADVEAILVRRLAGTGQQFLVSLDLCYELLGRMRRPRGGAGSGAVAEEITRFFVELAELTEEAHD